MILDGRIVSEDIITETKKMDIPHGRFVVIQIGDDRISNLYVQKKQELAFELKVAFEVKKFGDDTSEEQLLKVIEDLNQDDSIKGILVQIPLPPAINRSKVASAIVKKKDVDGFHYLMGEDGGLLPPTVLAIDALLNFYKIEKSGKKILIIGGGFLVGRPLYRFYKEMGCDASILEKDDPNYEKKIHTADIVVVATGGGKIFSSNLFKDGATVVDASTISQGGKIVGDIDKNSWPPGINLAPVPGGVGPLTVAMLFSNFFKITS